MPNHLLNHGRNEYTMRRFFPFKLAILCLVAMLCVQCAPAAVTSTPVIEQPTAQPGQPTGTDTFVAPPNPPDDTSTPVIQPSPTVASTQTTIAATQALAVQAYNWLQFNGSSQHSGVNAQETTITAANVGALARLFQVGLPAVADGAVVYLVGVQTPTGVHNLLFLTTKAGHILALDALTGAEIWSHQYPAGTCRINNTGGPCFTASSPAIDPGLKYVYSYGLDGFVHKYQVGDGTEIKVGGWPELATLKPYNEKVSPALSIATTNGGDSYLYVSNGGNLGDRGDYQGHITAIHLADGSQHVFNTLCSDQAVHYLESPATPDCPAVQSAVWARPGVVFDPATQKIYLATGNGTYDPTRYDWGDSVLALNPDGTGANGGPVDSFTPADFQQLDQTDADLGSTSPVILPVAPGSKFPHLAVQGGKDQLLRLINLDNLSGQNGPGHTGGEIGPIIPVPQGGQVFSTPAAWSNPADGSAWVFVTTKNGIAGIKINVDGSGNPSLVPAWQIASGGSSPILVNGVLFYATNGGKVLALDPTTGNILWSSSAIGGIHWESPVVVNGVLYITDESGRLTAFSLNGR
jgi:outer membrane protein assembly factor BamB